MVESANNNWKLRTKIVEFLLNTYPHRVINLSVKNLVNILDTKGFISDISDINLFYQSSEENIKNIFKNQGFSFSSDLERSSEADQKKNIIKQKTDYREVDKDKRSLSSDSSLILDARHPQSFYAMTSNISEMKLLMMDYGIKYSSSNPYYNLLKSDNREIEEYFSGKIRRRSNAMNNNIGAVIKYNDWYYFDNLHYRFIELGEEWNKAEEWIQFFWEIGRYINNYEGKITLFISYIARAIPATIASAGIVDAFYKTIALEKKDFSTIDYGFKEGDRILYRDGNTWRSAKVIGIEINEKVESRFNPYLVIEVARPAQPITKESVPNNLWKSKIRYGGIVSNSRGKSSIVKLNDRISEVLEKRYGKNTIDIIRVKPYSRVNLIGRGIDERIKDMYQGVQFADKKGTFMLTDILYFDNDKESSFVNASIVNNLNKGIEEDAISVFIGAKTGLDFSEYSTDKNIYFTSRVRQNYLDDTELLLNNLRQKSNKNREQQLKEATKLRTYLLQLGINIPKGVEFYVF